MKNIMLVMLLQGILFNSLLAEIKNGYEKNIPHFKVTLLKLKHALLNEHLTSKEARKIKKEIQSLLTYIAYYHVTDSLLKQFRAISPDQYEEINALTDFKNRSVDVYVKFVSIGSVNCGMAVVGQTPYDLHRCFSEYGYGTVSVKVPIDFHSLRALSHEFGHIKYVVPNLQSYIRFYHLKYKFAPVKASLGHHAEDRSGTMATSYEHHFRATYAKYNRTYSKAAVVPYVLYNTIRKNIDGDTNNAFVAEPIYTGNFLQCFPYRDKISGSFEVAYLNPLIRM
jgi:hypothetical protein